VAGIDGAEIVVEAMGQMAKFRGAVVADALLARFATRLLAECCEVGDIVEACRRLEVAERADGESSWPELGRFLRVTREARRDRMARESREREASIAKLHAHAPSAITGHMTRQEARAWIERLKRDVAVERERNRQQEAS
jgi:hypothetical protein